MNIRTRSLLAVVFAVWITTTAGYAAVDAQSKIEKAVNAQIRPLMKKYGVPGIAVGVTVDGKPYIFCYGVASTQSRQPVTADTLFEIGSISKTFTATLASYAEAIGDLSLTDPTSKYLPALNGSKFGNVSLLSLGTHTPGGLPLQVPDNIKNNDELLLYLKNWQPAYPPGTYRTYSNIGIGTLGWITAKAMKEDFATLMEQRLFPELGLKGVYIDVPRSDVANYAQGYTAGNAPIRMEAGVLSSEAYGVKATAPAMVRFLEANMSSISVDRKLQRAIAATHTGYYQAGPMTQDLIWEQYPYPVSLDALLEGNSSKMALHATRVTKINPPESPRKDVWINKTGSTNGFAAYVAFVPAKQVGIVILANKNYPTDARVIAAYNILTAIASEASGEPR